MSYNNFNIPEHDYEIAKKFPNIIALEIQKISRTFRPVLVIDIDENDKDVAVYAFSAMGASLYIDIDGWYRNTRKVMSENGPINSRYLSSNFTRDQIRNMFDMPNEVEIESVYVAVDCIIAAFKEAVGKE